MYSFQPSDYALRRFYKNRADEFIKMCAIIAIGSHLPS